MKKVVSNNLKTIVAGSVIAGSILTMSSCDCSKHKAEDLGDGNDVRNNVEEGHKATTTEETAKGVEGKCGEGKCGEGKCGEGKCGEGKCGGE